MIYKMSKLNKALVTYFRCYLKNKRYENKIDGRGRRSTVMIKKRGGGNTLWSSLNTQKIKATVVLSIIPLETRASL